jgi:predicted nucleic acid-binding protein
MAEKVAPTPIYPVVVDTDILIWYLRGNEKALRAIDAIAYSRRAISVLTLMELIQGCRNSAESRQVKAFISENFPQILYPNEIISRKAMDLLDRHAISHGLRVVDALIAASAMDRNASLATANAKHFRPIASLHLIPFKP